MNSDDIFFTFFIILAFAVLTILSMMESRRKMVADNWGQMKCNPTIMPFASYYGPEGTSISGNFNECMAKMQNDESLNFMGPVYDIMDDFASFGGAMQSELFDIQKALGAVTNSMNEMFSTFFILIANIVGGVYKVLATMKDTTERILAINELIKIYLDQSLAYIVALDSAAQLSEPNK